MMKKKKSFLLMALTLFLTLPFSMASAQSNNVAAFKIGNGAYNVNGTVKQDVAPFIKNNRTYLPLRYVAYACGIGDNSIAWDNEISTAYLAKGNELLKIQIGSHSMVVGNRTLPLDAPAEITKGRTMLPLRAISEALDCQVQWDEKNQLVTVTSSPK
jgi:trimeric autotransporter adhesin